MLNCETNLFLVLSEHFPKFNMFIDFMSLMYLAFSLGIAKRASFIMSAETSKASISGSFSNSLNNKSKKEGTVTKKPTYTAEEKSYILKIGGYSNEKK